MAGFSLGGGGGGHTAQRQGGGGDDEGNIIPPESLFLYSGGGGRGFELWQQHQHQIHQRPQQQLYSAPAGTTLLAFGGSDEPIGPVPARSSMRGSGSGLSCQDCGNQAKKDCVHMRCRTCCKSRGFQCPTHVKSTWVPAAKRRERQQQLASASSRGHLAGASAAAAPSAGGETSKRPRDHLSTAIATTTLGGTATEGVVSFPAEVSSPAVFRCVRVSPMDEAVDQFAYQTAVSIGGHLFRGILYDQGPAESRQLHHGGGDPSSGAAAVSIAAAAAGGIAISAADNLLSPDPSTLYPTPLSAFMAGTQFFPHHPRP